MDWGRGLAIWGLVATVLSLAPVAVLILTPLDLGGLVNALAVLLSLSVAPLAAFVASVGVLLLLVGLWRGRRP